jgi:predicted acyl esterase
MTPRTVLLTVLTALTVSATLVFAGEPAQAATTGFQAVDITAGDGVVLKANVISPTSAGPHPAVVFVNSWGLNDAEYLAQASDFANSGYVVLSYTTRGFWSSGGQIDTAGPKDVADASTAIDWLLAHTSADPAHIGMAGISYGAGISLIAAGHDSRVQAVAAMSGWTDLVGSLYGGNTRRPQAVGLLQGLAQLFGTPSAELNTVLNDYWTNTNIDTVKSWATVRSASTYVSAINAHHPAIMMANAYGDSLFPPNQLVDFYNQLTGPKRLELAPGDHAVVEATGLAGLDNHVWTNVHRWLDHYLAGASTGIDTANPVQLQVRESNVVESYPSWNAVATTTQRYGLGDVPWYSTTGPLTGSVTSGWSEVAWTGFDTTADAGVALLTNAFEALTGIPPTVWLPSVSRVNGAVWQSGSLGTTNIRGIPALHLSVRSARDTGTLVAYLYDVDWSGTGKLITHTPATWIGAPINATVTVTVPFPAVSYTVPSGHSIALVVDTQDPLYLDANTFGTAISIAGQSWVDLPLR